MKSFARVGFGLALGSALVAAFVACSSDEDTSPGANPTVDAGNNNPIDRGGSTPVDSGGSTTEDSAPPTTPVTLSFKAKVGTADFKCGQTYTSQGTTSDSVTPQDLRMYVQDVHFIDGTGKAVPVTIDTRSPWQTPQIVYLDFEDGTGGCKNGNADLNSTITGSVPVGTYTGLSFTVGVPEELDHADPLGAPPPLVESMTWGWLYGYRFLIAEMASMSTPAQGDPPGVGLLHLGSVGCDTNTDAGLDSGVTCTQKNRAVIKLDDFTPGTSTVVLDVAKIFAATDLKADSQCHSMGDSCPSMFASVGLKYEDGSELATQSAFHLE